MLSDAGGRSRFGEAALAKISSMARRCALRVSNSGPFAPSNKRRSTSHQMFYKTMNQSTIRRDFETGSPQATPWLDCDRPGSQQVWPIPHNIHSYNKIQPYFQTESQRWTVAFVALPNRTTAGDFSAAVAVCSSDAIRDESGRGSFLLASFDGHGTQSSTGQRGSDDGGWFGDNGDIESGGGWCERWAASIPGAWVVNTGIGYRNTDLSGAGRLCTDVEQVELAQGQVVNGGGRWRLIRCPACRIVNEVAVVCLACCSRGYAGDWPVAIRVECEHVVDVAEGCVADGDGEVTREDQSPG